MADESQEVSQGGSRRPDGHSWWNSLDARMYLRFGLMVVFMVAASVWLVHYVLESVVVRTGERYAEAEGNRLTALLEARIAAVEALAHALAGQALNGAEATNGSALDAMAESVQGRYPFIKGAGLTMGGQEAPWTWGNAGAFAAVTGWPAVSRGFLSAASKLPPGRFYWTAYGPEEAGPANHAAAVLPFEDGAGQRQQAAVLVQLDGLMDFVPSELPAAQGYVLLTDRENKPIAAPAWRGADARPVSAEAERALPAAVDRALDDLLRRLTARVAWEEEQHGAVFDALTQAGMGPSMRSPEVAAAAANVLDVMADETAATRLLQPGRIEEDPRVGGPARFAVFHVPGPYWRLTLVKPEAVLSAPFGDALLTLSATLATVMFAPPVIVLLLLRRDFVRPVRHLSRYLMGLEETEGDFLQGLGEGAPNELVELAQAFNQRTEALRAANVQLRKEFAVRERAEVALRESEARFRSVLENTRDMLCELNLLTKRYEYVSPASKQVLGFAPDELHRMGPKTLQERIHPEDAPLDEETDQRLLDTPADRVASAQLEYRVRNRDGAYVWISENRTLVRDKDGRAAAIVGSSRDVTERRMREQEIRRVRSYLRNILDSMPSVLVGVDGLGHVTHWNTEAARTTKAKERDVLGQPFEEAFPMLRSHAGEIRGAIEAGKPLSTQRIVADGEEGQHVYYDLLVYPLAAEDVEGAVIRVDDVSSRVQIEEMMVQTEKMMSVGGLAAGMAHEINNPLGGILQACQNIERRTKPDLPKNQQVAGELGVDLDAMARYLQERGVYDFIAGIRDDGQRAAKIVADMLAFSRRSESHFAPANLPDLVHTALRLAANDYDLKKHYDFRRIEIAEDFEPNLPQVRCDKTKIEQVLLNLVKNAAQAMGECEGLEDPCIAVKLKREDEWVQIEVLDNGPGMDEKTRRRVFEPFFTTKEPGVGTGLGLSVSYFIITKQHKGAMKVEPAPGRGTRFIIRLPLNVES